MKNLMINEDFIKKIALMDGEDTKQLLIWAYNYVVNELEPTKEEFNKAHFITCISFQEYKKYMDVYTAKWNKKANAVKEIKEIKTTSEL